MSLQVDPLAQYYSDDEEEEGEALQIDSADPLASYYEDGSEEQIPKKEPLVKQMSYDEFKESGWLPSGIDDEEYYKEQYEKYLKATQGSEEGVESIHNFMKGAISGATLGGSKKLNENLVPSNSGWATATGEFAGSLLPISRLMKWFGGPLVNFASKSPFLQKQLISLGNLTGAFLAGGTYGSVTEGIEKNKMPTAEDFINHGTEWALLDGALQAGGKLFSFIKNLLKKSKNTNKPSWEVVNETINKMKSESVDFSNAERVQAKAMSIIERETPRTEKGEYRKVTQPLTEEQAAIQKQQQKIEKRIEELKNQKVSPKSLDLLKSSEELAKPIIPSEMNPVEIIEESSSQQLETELNDFYERPKSDKQFGENIRADIEEEFKNAEKFYTEKYDKVKKITTDTFTQPFNFAKKAFNILEQFESVKSKPEGYDKVHKAIISAIEDSGFVINRLENGVVSQLIAEEEVSLSKLIELKKRLNKIIDYDVPFKDIKDILKPLSRELKSEITNSLKKTDKNALKTYLEAEKSYGETAEKFGTEALRKIRKTKTGERIANMIKSPTAVQDLKNSLSEKQFKEVEREILERLKNLSESRARDYYREIGPYLNSEAQILADDIIQSKTPLSSPNRRTKLYKQSEETIYNDLAKSSVTGERPKTTLNLWKTKKGKQLVKNSIKDTPNKNEIINYLNEQTFYDFTSSFIENDGVVNYKKLNELMRDPNILDVVREVGGDEAVNFFRNLKSTSSEIEQGMKKLQDLGIKAEELGPKRETLFKKVFGNDFVKVNPYKHVPGRPVKGKEGTKPYARGKKKLNDLAAQTYPWQTAINRTINNLSSESKYFLKLAGIVAGITSPLKTAGAVAGYKTLMKIATSPRIRMAIKNITKNRKNPTLFISALEAFDKEVKK